MIVKQQLKLSDGLSLPIDAMTQMIGVLGNRGSGKTNTAKVLVEEALRHGQQVVIVDPLDVWWGLKSSANGSSAGYPVAIFGGRHQDLPLSPDDGATVADLIVEHRIPAVLSLFATSTLAPSGRSLSPLWPISSGSVRARRASRLPCLLCWMKPRSSYHSGSAPMRPEWLAPYRGWGVRVARRGSGSCSLTSERRA